MLSSPERPHKRRRTSHGPFPNDSDLSLETPGEEEGSDLLTAQESSQGYDEGSDGDLSANNQQRAASRILKNCKPQETNFVTQLSQPASSPSALRGARWRKRSVTPPSPLAVPSNPIAGTTRNPPALQQQASELAHLFDDVDEEDLALAAAMSLSDCSDFENNKGPELPKPTPISTTGPMRQTTLFGTQAPRAQTAESRARTHNWPLTNRPELLTHHKLNRSACDTWVYPTNLGTVRDYQFNIVQKGLFHNLLVALPTGLGKTFIAATVMLNWFRWTEDAQIMFVAPTKPLVAQQVEACFGIVGIPRSLTSLLTGNTRPAIRAEEWQSKRVFFLTPQTLIHDLKTGICDPKKAVLLVVDEAHRATGNFAYVEIVRFLNRFNPSFRVLALTATPGSSVESVQTVIDSLNISRIEIRTEESLDIRQYVHSRNVDLELFDESEEMAMAMELFSNSLQPALDQLVNLGNAYWSKDPKTLTAFGLTKARGTWIASQAGRNKNYGLMAKGNALFTVLASLAHAIDLLRFHGLGSFYRNIRNFQDAVADGSNNGKYAKEIAHNENFVKLMNRLQGWISSPDFVGHPKLAYVKNVVLNHFMDAGEGHGMAGGRPPSDTRIMIFVHYRDSAEEVTRVLKRHEPMIRPHVFVGQSASKSSEAMNQKEQGQVIDKFKKGIYNTLVATSIGEEGLDIGEVDLIVCYDSSSSPIRMLQRMGRTGRKRAGKIVLLLMKGKEQDSYVKAKDNYEKMQHIIASGTKFTFREDLSARIIPKGIDPVVDKRVVEIPIENSQLTPVEPKKRSRVPKMPPKKFHMPDGVETGFVQASILNGKVVRKPRVPRLDLDVASLPPLESVLLTNVEQSDLERNFCDLGQGLSQVVRRPRLGAFPASQRTPRPTKKVSHSRVTKKMVALLDVIQRPLHYSPLSSPQELAGVEALDESMRFEAGSISPSQDQATPRADNQRSQIEVPSQDVMSSLASLSEIFGAKTHPLSQPLLTGDSTIAGAPDMDDDLPDLENVVASNTLSRRPRQDFVPQRKQTRIVDDSDDE